MCLASQAILTVEHQEVRKMYILRYEFTQLQTTYAAGLIRTHHLIPVFRAIIIVCGLAVIESIQISTGLCTCRTSQQEHAQPLRKRDIKKHLPTKDFTSINYYEESC